MRIGISTGYSENYWGSWFGPKQLGGSENLAKQLARQFARLGHETTLRLPYDTNDAQWSGVQLVGDSSVAQSYDLLFAFDDFASKDSGRTVLVACRSDPPPHTNFDLMVFLSKHMATFMGYPDSPAIGGGVDVEAFARCLPRIPRRVLCTSSPDRCPAAGAIGRAFDFVHTYKPVPGYATVEVTRDELTSLQLSAQVGIYPYAPTRESDFFSMAALEFLAAGTPLVISDGASLVELWGDAAVVRPRPIRMGEWGEAIDSLIDSPKKWQRYSELGRKKAADYDWPKVAAKYIEVATA